MRCGIVVSTQIGAGGSENSPVWGLKPLTWYRACSKWGTSTESCKSYPNDRNSTCRLPKYSVLVVWKAIRLFRPFVTCWSFVARRHHFKMAANTINCESITISNSFRCLQNTTTNNVDVWTCFQSTKKNTTTISRVSAQSDLSFSPTVIRRPPPVWCTWFKSPRKTRQTRKFLDNA